MSSDIAIKVENLSKCYQIYQPPLRGGMPKQSSNNASGIYKVTGFLHRYDRQRWIAVSASPSRNDKLRDDSENQGKLLLFAARNESGMKPVPNSTSVIGRCQWRSKSHVFFTPLHTAFNFIVRGQCCG